MFSGFDLEKPAQITFTHDYHELVTGDLKANAKLTLATIHCELYPKMGLIFTVILINQLLPMFGFRRMALPSQKS